MIINRRSLRRRTRLSARGYKRKVWARRRLRRMVSHKSYIPRGRKTLFT